MWCPHVVPACGARMWCPHVVPACGARASIAASSAHCKGEAKHSQRCDRCAVVPACEKDLCGLAGAIVISGLLALG
jgi:hypothetical protein